MGVHFLCLVERHELNSWKGNTFAVYVREVRDSVYRTASLTLLKLFADALALVSETESFVWDTLDAYLLILPKFTLKPAHQAQLLRKICNVMLSHPLVWQTVTTPRLRPMLVLLQELCRLRYHLPFNVARSLAAFVRNWSLRDADTFVIQLCLPLALSPTDASVDALHLTEELYHVCVRSQAEVEAVTVWARMCECVSYLMDTTDGNDLADAERMHSELFTLLYPLLKCYRRWLRRSAYYPGDTVGRRR